jgi:hypothetical protein
MQVLDLVQFDPTRNCFVLKGTPMAAQKCKCHPYSPFHWAHNQQPSVFAADQHFRAKGLKEKSAAQHVVDSAEREKRLIAYKQFDVYSKAGQGVKQPNKHEQ